MAHGKSKRSRVVDLLSSDAVAEAQRAVERCERIVERAKKELRKLEKLERETRESARGAVNTARSTSARLRTRDKLRVRSELRREQRRRVRELETELRARRRALRDAERKERAKRRAVTAFLREWERSYDTARAPEIADSSVTHRHQRPLYGEQIRAARSLLALDRRKFGELIGCSSASLSAMERVDGHIEIEPEQASAIRRRLERAGVDLIGNGFYADTGGPGARRRSAARGSARSRKRRGKAVSASRATASSKRPVAA